jgi:outer membrane protein OmpA-like peptidoglycan-associated protein
MRSSIAAILVGAMAVAGAANAAMAPRGGYPAEAKALGTAAAEPPSQGGCENGESRDDTGACPVVEDGDAKSRGFTLFSGSMKKSQGPGPALTAVPMPTARAVSQVRSAAPVAMAEGDTFHCGLGCDLKISFKSGSTVLTPESAAHLAKFAEALRDASMSRKRFEIAGHTDASGSPDKNLHLSQERADAVRTFLVVHGVPGTRLEAKGYGAEGLALPGQPLDPRNRRVEARALN